MTSSVARYRLDIICAIGGVVIGMLPSILAQPRDGWQFASLSLAYASIALLGATLLVGPLRVLKGQRPLNSSHLRRHLGVWSGIFAIAHVASGLNVHFRGHMQSYFFKPQAVPGISALRLDAFGLVNDLGLLATVAVIVLLAISNDRSLVALGTRRWKTVQRSTYLFALVAVAHGCAYQIIENRNVVPVLFSTTIYALIVIYQLQGFTRSTKINY